MHHRFTTPDFDQQVRKRWETVGFTGWVGFSWSSSPSAVHRLSCCSLYIGGLHPMQSAEANCRRLIEQRSRSWGMRRGHPIRLIPLLPGRCCGQPCWLPCRCSPVQQTFSLQTHPNIERCVSHAALEVKQLTCDITREGKISLSVTDYSLFPCATRPCCISKTHSTPPAFKVSSQHISLSWCIFQRSQHRTQGMLHNKT